MNSYILMQIYMSINYATITIIRKKQQCFHKEMPTFKRFLLLFLKQLQPEIPIVEISKHKEPPLMSSTTT